MNIFVLDRDPQIAATYHNDRHVVKMILESAQLLCSVSPEGEAPYRRTHYNHPCAVWTRTSLHNYEWLLRLALALCDEYTRRYGKTHKSREVIDWCAYNVGPGFLPNIGLTEFVQAMPDDCKQEDAVEAYRLYYRKYKTKIAKWKAPAQQPDWYTPVEYENITEFWTGDLADD